MSQGTELTQRGGRKAYDVGLDTETKVTISDQRFMEQYGYSWDYCIVFDVVKDGRQVSDFQKQFSMEKMVQRVCDAGLEVKMFFSTDQSKVFCKIRAPLDRLKQEADRTDYKLLLNPLVVREKIEEGWPKRPAHKGPADEHVYKIQPSKIEDTKAASKRSPYEFIYGKYESSEEGKSQNGVDQRLYTPYGRKSIPFRSVDRMKLLMSIFEAPLSANGCKFDFDKLRRPTGKSSKAADAAIVGNFPLHDSVERRKLQKVWMSPLARPNSQPFVEIKNYFGEKVALYFVWLGHYTTWLVSAALFGVVIQVIAASEGSADTRSGPFFGLFMCLWSTFFLEFWKRKESMVAMEWGMNGFEKEEGMRPSFQGEEISSPINGDRIKWFNPMAKLKKVLQSATVIATLVLMVAGIISSIFYFKNWSLEQEPGFWKDNGATVAALLNAVQIQVMNVIYQRIAEYLNDMENHHTDTQYEDNLIGKVFLFQFVNSYASFFYISFIKGNTSTGCIGNAASTGAVDNAACMTELNVALRTIFITRLVVGNLTEVGIPFATRSIKSWLRKRGNSKGDDALVSGRGKAAGEDTMSWVERQFHLQDYQKGAGKDGTFDDYAEMIIQFGYASLFVTAFPLAPLLALANNYVEIRVDAYKLLVESKRAEPKGAEDIGTWYTILEIMATAAVITNSLIVVFTANALFGEGGWYPQQKWSKWVIFVVMEHAIMFIKFGFALAVDDVPADVHMQLARQAYLVTKVIDHTADDDDEIKVSRAVLTMDIAESDDAVEGAVV